MIGIKGIASYLPEFGIDNISRAQKFGESIEFVEEKIGATFLPRKLDTEETSDLAVNAVKALQRSMPKLNLADIGALVVVTQNGDGQGLPHTSAIVQSKLRLSREVAAFDVSLGCSGYVYGLFVLQGFLQSSGLKNGILITADPYSKIINPEDRTTSMLFGDAATATWLGENPVWNLEHVAYGTDGSGADYLKVTDNQLCMNGRQIFNFAATNVAPHIQHLLSRHGLSPGDIDLYCIHQGSMAIVDAIARKFGELSSRFIKNMRLTGNTISSSIPILLEQHAFKDNAYHRILISGFGVGLSWATATIVINNKEVGNVN
jgi:3-oxoacyl-[acyl-carrier-protein] synthase-3